MVVLVVVVVVVRTKFVEVPHPRRTPLYIRLRISNPTAAPAPSDAALRTCHPETLPQGPRGLGPKGGTLSHPVPDPVIGPRRRTPTGPTGPPGLLFELSAPLTRYLLITYTSASAPTPDSACLRTPAPLRSIIPFILPPYLPYSCLPICIRFLVPDLDSCPYSSDSDRTSYTDSLP